MNYLLRKIIGWFNGIPIYKIYFNGEVMYIESRVYLMPEWRAMRISENIFSGDWLLLCMNTDPKYDLWLEQPNNDYLILGHDFIPIHDGDKFYTALKEINNN